MKEREWELDAIRVLACFFVIVIHVAGYGMEIKDPSALDWSIRNVILCIVRCSVPIFFMLSGILFLRREIPLQALCKKYIVHIITVWAVWSAFYAGIDCIAHLKTGDSSFLYFLERFFEGHYHLWFLPTLLGAYLLYPILRLIIQHGTELQIRYLGLLVLVGVVGKKTLDPFCASAAWDTFWENLGFPELSAGVIYFVLGYYLYQSYQRFSLKACIGIYAGSVILMSVINQLWALRIGAHTNVAYGYTGLGNLLASSAFLLLLLHILRRCNPGNRIRRLLQAVSEHSLGIYLIHTLLIEQVYRRVGLTQDRFPTLLSVAGFSVLTLLISFAGAWCIRKVPWIGRRVM